MCVCLGFVLFAQACSIWPPLKSVGKDKTMQCFGRLLSEIFRDSAVGGPPWLRLHCLIGFNRDTQVQNEKSEPGLGT